MPDGLLALAEGYLRTAKAAAANHDWPQAFENARTAAELAAKQVLADHGRPAVAKDHAVTPQLVHAGLWPAGVHGQRLSRFLGDYTRGVYGLSEPVRRSDAESGLRIAEAVLAKARP